MHNGEEKIVTNTNIYEYIELYTSRRMIKNYERAAQIIREGIISYINPNLEETFFDDLRLLDAEDFSLIMAGEKKFDLENLKKLLYRRLRFFLSKMQVQATFDF